MVDATVTDASVTRATSHHCVRSVLAISIAAPSTSECPYNPYWPHCQATLEFQGHHHTIVFSKIQQTQQGGLILRGVLLPLGLWIQSQLALPFVHSQDHCLFPPLLALL